MILNENQLEIQSQCMFLNESLVFSDNDIWWNRKAWKKKEINTCFILGFAGSGKSTLSRAMAKGNKDNLVYVEMDMLVENAKYKDEVLLERNPFLYEFLKGPGKRYRGLTINSTFNVKREVREFVSFCIRKQRYTKCKLILEGIQLFIFFDPSELEKYAVCIKGTSYLISSYRVAKRELLEKRIIRSIGSLGLNTAGLPIFNAKLSRFISYYKNKVNKKENN